MIASTLSTAIDEASPHRGSTLGMIPQLDGLRAFAVAGVLITHYIGQNVGVFGQVNWGLIGVRLFFVISGFLITSILLEGRAACKQTGAWQVARVFYARRLLRIFPIFYVVLGCAALLGLPHVRESFWWHAGYLSNFWIAKHGWVSPVLHLWSLAVEEQFYLVWPAFVLLAPERWLVRGCVLAVAGAVCYRLLVTKMGGWLWASVMTPACFDTLAAGALLAIVRWRGGQICGRDWQYWARWGVCIGLPMYIVIEVLHACGVRFYDVPPAFGDLWLAMAFVWLVGGTLSGFGGIVGRVLEWPVLRYIGKISYGVYLVHNFVPMALEAYLPRVGLAVPQDWRISALLYTVVTLLIAVVSWEFFEKRVNALKSRFAYPR